MEKLKKSITVTRHFGNADLEKVMKEIIDEKISYCFITAASLNDKCYNENANITAIHQKKNSER